MFSWLPCCKLIDQICMGLFLDCLFCSIDLCICFYTQYICFFLLWNTETARINSKATKFLFISYSSFPLDIPPSEGQENVKNKFYQSTLFFFLRVSFCLSIGPKFSTMKMYYLWKGSYTNTNKKFNVKCRVFGFQENRSLLRFKCQNDCT